MTAASFTVFCAPASYALDCARDTPAAPTILCVQFAMRAGRISAAAHALSDLSPEMRARLKAQPSGGLEAFALAVVETELAKEDKPYPDIPSLRDMNGSWAKFTAALSPLIDGVTSWRIRSIRASAFSRDCSTSPHNRP